MLETPAGADPRHYINESQEMKQMHYNGGIAAAFLAQLYLATGDQQWLDLARAYQAFSMNSTERQFDTKQVCKSGWGAACSGWRPPTEYRAWLVRMGDWFTREQTPDGHWDNTPALDPGLRCPIRSDHRGVRRARGHHRRGAGGSPGRRSLPLFDPYR